MLKICPFAEIPPRYKANGLAKPKNFRELQRMCGVGGKAVDVAPIAAFLGRERFVVNVLQFRCGTGDGAQVHFLCSRKQVPQAGTQKGREDEGTGGVGDEIVKVAGTVDEFSALQKLYCATEKGTCHGYANVLSPSWGRAAVVGHIKPCYGGNDSEHEKVYDFVDVVDIRYYLLRYGNEREQKHSYDGQSGEQEVGYGMINPGYFIHRITFFVARAMLLLPKANILGGTRP